MNELYVIFLAVTEKGLFRVNIPDETRSQFLEEHTGDMGDQELMATELDFGGSGSVETFQRMFAFYGKSEINVNAFCNGFEYAFSQIG